MQEIELLHWLITSVILSFAPPLGANETRRRTNDDYDADFQDQIRDN